MQHNYIAGKVLVDSLIIKGMDGEIFGELRLKYYETKQALKGKILMNGS